MTDLPLRMTNRRFTRELDLLAKMFAEACRRDWAAHPTAAYEFVHHPYPAP